MHYTEQIEKLKQRLQQPLPGIRAQNRMAGKVRKLPLDVPHDAKKSGVLALLFPKQEELNLLLIRRTEDGRAHGGQISFPGGRHEPEDANLQMTALRETYEEVGVPSEHIEVVGSMSTLYIPVSNSDVHPFVGFTNQQPEYVLSTDEVQYVLEVPVNKLFIPDIKTVKSITPSAYPDITIKAPAYQWDDQHTIWGATAMMIAELEELINC